MLNEKEQWFNLFEDIYNKTDNLSSGIDCVNHCDGRCCPQKTVGGHTGFVIFLPFEMEYIASKMSLEVSLLEKRWLANRVFLISKSNVNSKIPVTWTRHCPFINSGTCGIYTNRPFDCRVFPVIRRLGDDDQLKIIAAQKCPEHKKLSADFQEVIGELWKRVDVVMPLGWLPLRDSLIVSDDNIIN